MFVNMKSLLLSLCCLRLLPLSAALPQGAESLLPCGDAYYYPSKYTCYPDDFLCPVLDGVPTLRCGPDCYLPSMYSCENDKLVYPPFSAAATSATSTPTSSSTSGGGSTATCSSEPSTLQLSDPPYKNYFYSDCNSASQVVVTSPLPGSNLTLIGPRLLVAWPAGNSGTVVFFQPGNGINGTLGIQLVNSTSQEQPLSPVYNDTSSGSFPTVGVAGSIQINSSAVSDIYILGSIRTIRDFTEGPSIIVPVIQNAISFIQTSNSSIVLSRLWLDNITTTRLSFTALDEEGAITRSNRTLHFEAGTYEFSASYNYPQMDQLSPAEVLKPGSQQLLESNPDQTKSLSFLSHSDKLLAGAWRFLTYFGRDSMVSLLLLDPVLSEGEGGAVEAVIGAVLERINKTDGSVCHEETIGDYATYLNLQDNITSTEPQFDYKMIDSDYYLPIVTYNYFVNTETGQQRSDSFFNTTVSAADPANAGMTYRDLVLLNAEKIVNTSAPFASRGGQTQSNLIRLKEDQVVGEWRDSTYGLGGGRVPYDVNTALVPAALRAIAALSAAGFFPEHPDWSSTATQYAQIWEDETLRFFEVTVPQDEARDLVDSYLQQSSFYDGPSNAANITADIVYHAVALEGNNDQSTVKVMNTDDCFRLFLVNSTNQTQLTAFMDQTATNILLPFPAGLSTPVGLIVANPAYGGDPVYAANFTNADYHGTVVWSWQLAMMAKGLERQSARCSSNDVPDFCMNNPVHTKVLDAYNHLWDLIDANSQYLNSEVWSWSYSDGAFQFSPLGAFSPTESNIRQLWSLTFLAVQRNQTLTMQS